MIGGYIKNWRSMLEWEHYTDINTFKLFMHFLYTANIKDMKYMGQIIPRGSLVIKERTIGNETGLEYQEVRTAIKKLLASGEITKKSTNKFTVINIVNFGIYQDFDNEQQRTSNAQATHKQRTINELSTHIEEEGKKDKKNKKNKKNNKEILCPATPNAGYQIIEYLNLCTGSNFKPNTKATQSHINARLNEGFTIDNFKTVIDKKLFEWGEDPKMVIYLRPSTLFGTKFESYLNQRMTRPMTKTEQAAIETMNYEFKGDYFDE